MDSLLIVAPIVCGVSCLVLVLLCSTQFSYLFCNDLAEEERVGCVTLIVCLMSSYCKGLCGSYSRCLWLFCSV